MTEAYTAVIEEIVCPGAGLEFPGRWIARHAGNHIDELDQPFGTREETAPTNDLVSATSTHLLGKVKGLTEALCIGRFD